MGGQADGGKAPAHWHHRRTPKSHLGSRLFLPHQRELGKGKQGSDAVDSWRGECRGRVVVPPYLSLPCAPGLSP